MFARKKMGVEGDVEAVSKLYDTEWAKCAEQAQKRVVSTVNWYFTNLGESDVSQDSIRVNEENANAAGAAHKDRMAKIEAEEGRKQAEQELEREAIRRKQEEDRRKQAEVEREREKRRAEREKQRAERLEEELRALRENHGVRN
jgi:Skp family chaperone for outer membrane proteins